MHSSDTSWEPGSNNGKRLMHGRMHGPVSKTVAKRLQSLSVLIVEDSAFIRRMVRHLLLTIGVNQINEAADGIEGLEAIRLIVPDLVLLDWEMPLLNGPELVRIVRSPGVFPIPDLPIIILSAHRERWRVMEAMRLGVNEYLVKPVSAETLQSRILGLITNPRPMVHRDGYYGPEPRRLLPGQEPDAAAADSTFYLD